VRRHGEQGKGRDEQIAREQLLLAGARLLHAEDVNTAAVV
jgi:hypothetical protein